MLIAAAVFTAFLLAAPLLLADAVLRHAWAGAEEAGLLAMVVALPLAIGMWRFARPGRMAVGVLVAALAVAGLAAQPAAAAQAALGVPVAVLALAARLRQVPPETLRIAATSGLSPAASWRLVLAPLLAPAVFAGFLIVFAAVLANGLRANPGQDWALPVASMAAWMIWMLPARG